MQIIAMDCPKVYRKPTCYFEEEVRYQAMGANHRF